MYKPGTIYEAKVETGDKIHFMFYHSPKASHVQIKRSDVSDSGWLDYLLIPDVDLHYHAPNGVWILHIAKGCYPTWLFEVKTAVKKGLFYAPIITRVHDKAVVHSVVHTTPYGGRHYDVQTEDYIGSSVSTPEDAIKAIKWYEKAKKEVRSKMKSLFHVILFNRKTEEIDYKAYVPAIGETEAGMTAAHDFDKYDGKVHQHIVKHIADYDVID